MATIDPNIALGVRPIQIENPLNQMAAYSQIQNAQQGQQLNALQMRKAQQEFDTQNALAEAYKGAFNQDTGALDYNLLTKQLAQRGAGSAIPALLKTQRETQQAEATLGKTLTETQQKKLEIQKEQFANLSFNPSDENVKAHLQDSVLKGELPQVKAEQLWSQVASLTPAQRTKYFTDMGLKAVERVTTAETARANTAREANAAEQLKVSQGNLGVAQGNLGVNRQQLQLAQDKALREQTTGTIPAGYRLNKETNELEAIPGGPTTVALPPKEKQKREAIYPKATSAIKAFENTSDDLIKDLAELRNHPGLSSITGIAAGRLPGVTKEGRAAQALYDKIVARGGFQALTDLKAAGGTLGAVSNQEGTQLKDSYAAINRTQDAADVRKALDQALANTQRSKDRVREEYDTTYEYRNTVPRSSAASSAAPNQPTVNIKSNAEYDALPSGTIFIDPNGQQRRKP
jgi:hypothetical protein